jgi:hypothetical protein
VNVVILFLWANALDGVSDRGLNIFGFPNAPGLSAGEQNAGLLDRYAILRSLASTGGY